ncbi:MAG: multiheme c-type cytochrome [Alcanivoracaceae bacterium]|nr:multiheme c-type cytochrome [Alcanivoracaceae bacterium]
MNRLIQWLFACGAVMLAMTVCADEKHMGVATCASSVCHGNATSKPDANILHSEYVIWGQEDPHAGAYNILLSVESARIAAKLNIGRAEEAPVCLSCHSDYVAKADRGERFQLSDGVGCEGCHGGAGKWLETHTVRGATHDDNIAHGLRALEKADVKAQLCQSCHIGGEGRFAGHDIMGAGHPRLQFELANYSAALPEHHRVDDDYRKRKATFTELQLWSEGQLQSALNVLDGIGSERFYQGGMWPELAFFDCHVCHQAMSPQNWQQRDASKDLPPGTVRLNDSALIMASLLWQIRNESAAKNWSEGVRALHRASQKGVEPTREVAGMLKNQVRSMIASLQKKPLSDPEASRLLRLMVAYSREQSFNDYLTAEQITMAINIMMHSDAVANPDAFGAPLDALYDSLGDQHTFQAWKFRQAMDRFSGQLR